MARPKKDDETRKSFTIKIRVTAKEKETIEKRANYCGYSNLSAFIRDAATGDTVDPETNYIWD